MSLLLALQGGAATQPIAHDEWNWDEAVQPEFQILSYQNADAPASAPAFDTEWDWGEQAADEWVVDAQVATAAIVAQAQPADTEWDWGELLYAEPVAAGYQTADYTQPTPVYFDDWQWDQGLDDEWPTDAQVGASVVAVSPVQQLDAEWDWDETLSPEAVPTGYQNADNAAIVSTAQQPQTEWDFDADFGGEDGWANHTTGYDAPALPELVWDWEDHADDEWWTEDVAKSAAVAVSPVQQQDAEWDWDEFVSPEFLVLEYQTPDAAVVVSTELTAQTDWDFDADFGGEDGWANHTTGYDAPALPETGWDWAEEGDDSWWVDETLSGVQAPVPDVPAQDAWDWDESVADELPDTGTQGVGFPAPPRHAEPEWDWDAHADDSEWVSEIMDAPVGADRPGAYISAYHTDLIYELALLHGLVPGNPMAVSATQRSAGALLQQVSEFGAATTVTTVSHDTLHGDVLVWIEALAAVHGLIAPLVVTPTTRDAGTLSQVMNNDGTTTTVETP